MKPLRLLPLTILASVLPVLGGCNDATGPGDLGGLDPDAVTGAMNALAAPLNASTEATSNLGGAVPDLTAAGVQFLRTDRPVRLPSIAAVWFDAALEPLVPLATVDFPPAVRGSTFAFVLDQQAWEVDAARTGAPNDGVRVLWYDLDSQGRIEVPLDELGTIDLTPRTGGAADSLAMTIVEALESGDLTVLDMVQARETTGTDIVNESFTATGTYADDSSSVDFVIISEEAENAGSGDSSYSLEITLEGADASYVLRVQGSVNGATGGFEDELRATAVHDGSTTVLNVVFRGTNDVQEEASGTFEQDGVLIANVDIEGSTFDFSTPDGGSFSPEQGSQLNRLFRALTLNGFEVLFNLPLFLPE